MVMVAMLEGVWPDLPADKQEAWDALVQDFWKTGHRFPRVSLDSHKAMLSLLPNDWRSIYAREDAFVLSNVAGDGPALAATPHRRRLGGEDH